MSADKQDDKPCDKNFHDGGAHTVRMKNGVSTCTACDHPIKDHAPDSPQASETSERYRKAKELLDVQGAHGNWNYDPYMHGMYNGMEVILAVVENREPVFKDAPDVWIADINPTGEQGTERSDRKLAPQPQSYSVEEAIHQILDDFYDDKFIEALPKATQQLNLLLEQSNRNAKISMLNQLAHKKNLQNWQENYTPEFARGFKAMQDKVKFELNRLKTLTPEKE